jgi:hypothetical protein
MQEDIKVEEQRKIHRKTESNITKEKNPKIF